jgi:hypothetical protein
MGTRQAREVGSSTYRLQIEPLGFTANSTSAVASSTFKGPVHSVTRTGTGTFSVVLKETFPTIYSWHPGVVTTAGTKVVVKSYTSSTKTLVLETRKASATAAVTPAWTTGLAVSSHTATLTTTGAILAVDATAGTSAGGKKIISTGTPSAGYVKVTYSAGIPTFLFNTTDAITATSYLQAPTGPSAAWETVAVSSHTATLTGRVGYIAAVHSLAGTDAGFDAIISTGTPGDHEVKVTYSSGVPTLTFNTADAITSAAVLFVPMDLVSEPLVDTSEAVSVIAYVSNSTVTPR